MLAIPNFSEGRDRGRIASIGRALAAGSGGVRLLDTHSDPDHHRTVYTLAATRGAEHGAGVSLVESLLAGAVAAADAIDIRAHDGLHPRVGAIDVAPIVYLDEAERGSACAAALLLADRVGHELDVPVFLYGILTDWRVTRAGVRRGGSLALAGRIASGEQIPDFGPRRPHPRLGAILVGARAPLIAFNVELAPPATLLTAREIAALIREGGAEGLPSVRAIGLTLPHRGGVAQVSTNVEDYRRTSPAAVIEAISRHATPVRAEVVGVPPRAAFEGFPAGLTVANLRYLEDVLASGPDPPATRV